MITKPGDVVMIHQEDKLAGYARVEDIIADHKAGWWHISLLVLAAPVVPVTWILKEEYIDGAEFTMGGVPMRLERLPDPKPFEPPPEDGPLEQGPAGEAPGEKVVSLRDRRKKP